MTRRRAREPPGPGRSPRPGGATATRRHRPCRLSGRGPQRSGGQSGSVGQFDGARPTDFGGAGRKVARAGPASGIGIQGVEQHPVQPFGQGRRSRGALAQESRQGVHIRGGSRRPSRPALGGRARLGAGLQDAPQQIDENRSAVGVHDDIGRRHVSMNHAPLVQMRQRGPEVVEQPRGLVTRQSAPGAQHDRQIGSHDEVADHAHASPRQGDHLPNPHDRLTAQQPKIGQATQGAGPGRALGHIDDLNHDVAPGGIQGPPRSEVARPITPHRLPDRQTRRHQLIADLDGQGGVLGGRGVAGARRLRFRSARLQGSHGSHGPRAPHCGTRFEAPCG